MQHHINIAVAYNVWQYYEGTGDLEFLAFCGTEMLVEIARLWAGLASYRRALDRYEIRGVMGPDEFHDAYLDAEEPGLNNNAYTNVMAVWALQRAAEALELTPEFRRQELWEKLGLAHEELEHWSEISTKMLIPFHDGVISQFEGYADLKEFDWLGYTERYGDIMRLDRILEAEGDTPNRYKLSKQADVLMLFYLLSATELEELLTRLGYEWDPELIPRTIDYLPPPYIARFHPQPYRALLGPGPFGSREILGVLPSGAPQRRQGHTGRDDSGGNPPRGDGRHRRPGAAGLHRAGDPARHTHLRSRTAGRVRETAIRHPLPQAVDHR